MQRVGDYDGAMRAVVACLGKQKDGFSKNDVRRQPDDLSLPLWMRGMVEIVAIGIFPFLAKKKRLEPL